jgi:ketosteroid isomerase-like protein
MTTAQDLAIRMKRASFNRALADGDLTAIASILAPDAMLVAGTDSAVISGRKAQIAAWKREFAATERSIYVRTPQVLTISPVLPLAFEQGEWKGVSAATGEAIASGSYTAKWRQFGGEWMIEAELYITLA